MEIILQEIEIYLDNQSEAPFSSWLNSLHDIRARAKIRTRLDRLKLGNFGDCKSVGSGVLEMRIDFGPGFRVYFGRVEGRIVLLLCGGDKGSQKRDVQKAKSYWQDFLSVYEKKNKKIPR